MRTTFAFAVGLAACAGLALGADDKAAASIEGKYTLVSGKKFGADPDEYSMKAAYTITKDTVTIQGKNGRYVMAYKLDPKTKPMNIDMEITEGPEGAKGAKALGIVEPTADGVKIAYSLEMGKRPKDFDGKEGMLFVFKKAK